MKWWPLAIVLSFWIGATLGHKLAAGRQETYFEANSFNHFFFLSPVVEAPLTAIVEGEWDTVCSQMQFDLDRTQMRFGTVVDEGVLNYLDKIVVMRGSGEWGLMNFDERLFQVTSAKECMPFRNAIVRKTVVPAVDDDPNGLPSPHTSYELLEGSP